VRDVTLAGPAGVQILSGASSLSELADVNPASLSDVLHQLEELEQVHDFLVIDAGTGFQPSARRFLAAADVALIVTTPEPTAIADAYAVIKSVSPAAPARVEVVVNQCGAAPLAQAIVERLAQTSRLFVRMDVHSAGWIPADADVGRAVARRTPFCLASPQGAAAQASRQIARRLQALAESRSPTEPFFSQLAHRPRRPHT
jgi:flagellar biosynthesis protein FlhG